MSTRVDVTQRSEYNNNSKSGAQDGCSSALAMLRQIDSDLKSVLYENENKAIVENFDMLEQKTGAKREQIAYGVIGAFALYLIVGRFAKLASNLVGIIYPAYASFKSLRTETNKEEEQQWYTFWVAFGLIVLLDEFSEPIWRIFPIYYLVKAIAFLYLALPQVRGAHTLYHLVVEPAIAFISSKIQ